MTAPSPTVLSRRDFLKQTGLGAASLTAATVLGPQVTPALAAEPVSDQAWGVLIDLTRCNGCNSCALACKEANGRPEPELKPTRLDSHAYSFIDVREETSGAPAFVKRQCMHCLHPACVSACTVGAMRKSPEGPVVYDSKKCIGCRYCQYACPFGVPTFDWDNPLGLIHKCQMCVSRLGEGALPACVDGCPAGALRFGRRQDLLVQARAQINTNPGRYVDHVYGEHEAGGTSVLYMAGIPFAELGLPVLGPEPIPRYAEPVMKATPVMAVTVASLVTGLYWLMKRRVAHPTEVLVEVNDRGGER